MRGMQMCPESLEDELLDRVLRDMPEPMIEFSIQLRQRFSSGAPCIALHIDRGRSHPLEALDHGRVEYGPDCHDGKSVGIGHWFDQDHIRQEFLDDHSYQN